MNAGRRWWVADDEPNQRFTLYSRGNVGEVFPHVITALTGTLIGEAVRDGQVGLFSEMGVLRAHEIVGPSVSTGVFGSYLYMNASVMRLFASRMPGVSIRDADEQVMGNIPDVPPHRRSKGDRNALATLRLIKFSMTLMRRPDLVRLDSARDEARAWLATMPEFSTATDHELLAWLSTFLPRQRASMTRLMRSSSIAGAPRGLLDRAVSGERFPAGLANRIVSGTGDIDSAQLPRQLWALGRLVAADAELTQLFNDGLFDDGLGDIATRSAHTPMHAAVKTFLGEYGHRGNNEYELAAPAWVMDPAPVYAAIDRLRNGQGRQRIRQARRR